MITYTKHTSQIDGEKLATIYGVFSDGQRLGYVTKYRSRWILRTVGNGHTYTGYRMDDRHRTRKAAAERMVELARTEVAVLPTLADALKASLAKSDVQPSAATIAAVRPRTNAATYSHMTAVRQLATQLMTEHGLAKAGWHLRFDNATRRAGGCAPGLKYLTFSRKIMSNWTLDACRLTILHEIAHALTPGHHHDRVWQRKCLEIGGDGKRCWQATDDAPLPPMPWIGTCPNGHESGRTRAPKAGTKHSCSRCSRRYNPAYLITWTRR